MKKLLSAATSACMAATMIGSVVPAVTSAADATKGFSIKTFADSDSKYAKDGSTVTISQADIDAGDVVVPCAVYLTEGTPDTESFSVQCTVNSKDGDAKAPQFKFYGPNKPYYGSDKTFETAQGSVSTSSYIAFAGTYDDLDGYMEHGSFQYGCDSQQMAAGTDNAYVGYAWINGGASYQWMGSKSDDYPVFVFDVTFPKGTKAGTYTIDYCNWNTDGSGANINPSCMIETKGGRFANYPSYLNNLDLNTMTIKVGDPGNTDPVTTTSTTTKPVATTTTTTKKPDTNVDADVVFDFGSYTAKAGDSITIPVKIDAGTNPVSAMDVVFSIDSPLEITKFGGKSPACGNASVMPNVAEKAASFTSLDGSDPIVPTKDGIVFNVVVQVPADCKDGVYHIGFADKCQVFKDGTNFNYSTAVLNGDITVGNPVDDGTTTTAKPNNTTTTTTTKKPDTNVDADIVFDFGNYAAKAGESVTVPVKIDAHDNPVSAMDVVFAIDSPLEITKFGGKSPACGNASVMPNVAEKAASFTSLDGSDPIVPTKDGIVFNVVVQIPADCADGVYKIGFADKCQVFKDGTNFNYSTAVLNGEITVGNPVDDGTTTTTTKATTTTTKATTTTTAAPGTPVWGDTNCDGVVNVADVVLLNKWLADNDSYDLSTQGALNADCFNPQGGKAGLTSADSDAIIKSIVHLVTLPVQG